jgi:hypothetical protein
VTEPRAGNGDAPDPGLPAVEAPQRVSGMRLPERWTQPGRPAELDPAAEDAWRQSGFLLGEVLALLDRGFELQLRLAATGYEPTARTMTMAALASQWSRALTAQSEALSLARRGGYGTAVALVRQAVELVAAQIALAEAEMNEFRRWAHRAYERHEPTRAEVVGLGHYFAGEAIANDEALRRIYRAASDLARPNFGATALFVAGEAGRSRYPLIFGDQAFHLGWGQLLTGWLALLGERQIHLALHARAQFPAGEELRGEAVAWVRDSEALREAPDRCRLEEWSDEDGRRRHLLSDFRRRPGDAPQRILL